VCFGLNATCAVGCDGIVDSGKILDNCGVCGGNNSTCIHDSGISRLEPNGMLIIFSIIGVTLFVSTILTVTMVVYP